ncbi:hypothetical protein [Nocardia sp. CA-119907]|uniref:hypothetical protein n=1 Tax=Nocardia sp. CA-119907 TaxID=3239973 RepID=UPI003D98BAD3
MGDNNSPMTSSQAGPISAAILRHQVGPCRWKANRRVVVEIRRSPGQMPDVGGHHVLVPEDLHDVTAGAMTPKVSGLVWTLHKRFARG